MSAKSILALAVAGLTLSGCSTYLDAKADLRAGGPQQRVAAAQSNLTQAQQQNQNLQDQKLQVERDIERNEKRIAAQQAELRSTEAALAEARAKRKVSQDQYARLKAESDAINRELNTLDLQLQADRNDPAAAAGIAAKEARLKELERRKGELDQAIAKALAG